MQHCAHWLWTSCKYVSADLYTVSRCRTNGESEDHTGKKAYMGSNLALIPRASVIKSPKNRSISGPTKRTFVLQMFFFNQKKLQ